MLKRYTLPPMRELWSEERKFQGWLEVELAWLWAKVNKGQLSQLVYDRIYCHAKINVERIEQIDVEIRHDLIAFVTDVQTSLEEGGVGEHKEEIHKGLTSFDTEDPALIIRLCEAANLIGIELCRLHLAIIGKAREHRQTYLIADTHGQDAEPSTFGLLLKTFQTETERNIFRLETVIENDLSEGKMSGAVGTYGGMDPELEKLALSRLGLKVAKAETQILQRDRHANLLCTLAVIAGSVERIARTFWEMMRSRTRELAEPRKSKQKGSSAMSHKRNPIGTEQLMGLPRLIRGYAMAALENQATPGWRDISQSSVERHILPDSTSLTHYLVVKIRELVEGLVVYPELMQKYLTDDSCEVWASQNVRIALMDAGVDYETAYRFTQQTAFEAVDQGRSFRTRLSTSKVNSEYLAAIIGPEKFAECFDYQKYLARGIETIYSRT